MLTMPFHTLPELIQKSCGKSDARNHEEKRQYFRDALRKKSKVCDYPNDHRPGRIARISRQFTNGIDYRMCPIYHIEWRDACHHVTAFTIAPGKIADTDIMILNDCVYDIDQQKDQHQSHHNI